MLLWTWGHEEGTRSRSHTWNITCVYSHAYVHVHIRASECRGVCMSARACRTDHYTQHTNPLNAHTLTIDAYTFMCACRHTPNIHAWLRPRMHAYLHGRVRLYVLFTYIYTHRQCACIQTIVCDWYTCMYVYLHTCKHVHTFKQALSKSFSLASRQHAHLDAGIPTR